MLYAFGLAAHRFWFMFDDEPKGAKIRENCGKDYHKYYRAFPPNGIDPKIFDNRGVYDDYFAGHAKIKDG